MDVLLQPLRFRFFGHQEAQEIYLAVVIVVAGSEDVVSMLESLWQKCTNLRGKFFNIQRVFQQDHLLEEHFGEQNSNPTTCVFFQMAL